MVLLQSNDKCSNSESQETIIQLPFQQEKSVKHSHLETLDDASSDCSEAHVG